MEGDGGFGLANRAGVGSAVGLGDRLADDADLFALNRHLDGLGLGDNVLAQVHLAGLDAVLGNVELLLGTDELVAVGTSHTSVSSASNAVGVASVGSTKASGTSANAGSGSTNIGSRNTSPSLNAITSSASVNTSASSTIGRGAGLVGGHVLDFGQGVVAVEGVLVVGGEVAVVIKIRGVLDAVLGEGQVEVAITKAVAAQRNDGGAGAEQAVVDGDKVRLAGGVVDVDVLDGTDLVAVHVVSGCVCKVLNAVEVSHWV